MPHAQRFEDLIAWQKARHLTKLIYSMTREREFARDRALSTQLQRAAVSIMSNVAEGCERPSDKEFAHFLAIAKGSCSEVRSQCYIALDAGYISQAQFNELYAVIEEVTRIVGGLRYAILRRIRSDE